MEIETARNGTNRLRRECSIKTIKLMIEQWPNIVKPNPELSSMIQKRLLIGKATVSYRDNNTCVFKIIFRVHFCSCYQKYFDVESIKAEVGTILLSNSRSKG